MVIFVSECISKSNQAPATTKPFFTNDGFRIKKEKKKKMREKGRKREKERERKEERKGKKWRDKQRRMKTKGDRIK